MSRKELWADLGRQLGFEYKAGIRAFLESASGRRELEDRARRGEIPSADLSILDNPLVARLIELVFDGALVGTHRGYEFTLFPASESRSSGSGSTQYSNVSMFFRQGYTLELSIYNETFMSRIGKLLFFQQDIQLGEPELDRLIMIKGNDELAVKRLLDTRRVRDLLRDMFSTSHGFLIRDYGIKHQEVAEVISPERAVELMDRMADLADALPE